MRRVLLLATLLGGACPVGAAEPPLGRLFFTAEDRATLDEARRRKLSPAVVEPTSAVEKKPAPSVTVNGMIRRSDGQTTVWVNNKPVTSNRTEQGIGVTPPAAGNERVGVRIRVPDILGSVDLKVGQRFEPASGSVRETYTDKRSAPLPVAGAGVSAATPEPARARRGGRDDPYFPEPAAAPSERPAQAIAPMRAVPIPELRERAREQAQAAEPPR